MYVDTLNLIVHVHNNNYKQIKKMQFCNVHTSLHTSLFN